MLAQLLASELALNLVLELVPMFEIKLTMTLLMVPVLRNELAQVKGLALGIGSEVLAGMT